MQPVGISIDRQKDLIENQSRNIRLGSAQLLYQYNLVFLQSYRLLLLHSHIFTFSNSHMAAKPHNVIRRHTRCLITRNSKFPIYCGHIGKIGQRSLQRLLLSPHTTTLGRVLECRTMATWQMWHNSRVPMAYRGKQAVVVEILQQLGKQCICGHSLAMESY